MPKEDLLHHLDECVDFISQALQSSGNVLVHCYFGVSRSSSAVIAYLMKQHNLEYRDAFQLVRAKRRFVQPNNGFVAQLKLYRRMDCQIDKQNEKYKLYLLRLAGDQMRTAKILPQHFHNIVKADPAITQENPEPIVYRCRKCRRVLASKNNILWHGHKAINDVLDGPSRDWAVCDQLIFVEPIAWMKNITCNTQGRIHCPKCEQKLGKFSWINGCKCQCGQEVSPAFYFIPSKVELTKAVQNVQITV